MNTTLATILILTIIALFCIATYAHSLEVDHANTRADLDDLQLENNVLVSALAAATIENSDTRIVSELLQCALRHSLCGDADSAWAILGELGDTKHGR